MLKKTGKYIYVFFSMFWLCAWIQAPTPLYGQMQKPTEYQAKAAFIYNFLQFVEWPPKPAKGPKPSLNFCILGENSFGSALEPYQGETIRGRNLSIKPAHSLQDLRECQVLFISSSEKGRLTQITKLANELGILTIGDAEGFGHHGVMINFFLERNKVRFEINTDAVHRSGLKISSQLLKLARIVRDPL